MNMNRRQLTFVREYKGYSQTELSSHIQGLSQSNLSKFEKGIGQLSDEVKQRIIDFLGFPKEFYDLSISNQVDHTLYRKKASLTKKTQDEIEQSNKIIGYIIDQMSESIDYPPFSIKPLDLEDGFTPEYAAKYTRKYLGILQGPVRDICTLLENYGIIIVERNVDTDEFDGVSFFTDEGFPVMVINKNFDNDRKRLTIAHELGHIVMHLSPDIAISDYSKPEQEANRFAAEFLMPESEIKNSLIGLKLQYLMPLKQYWLTSMASIIYRAKDLKCITADKCKYFYVEMSRKGYRKKEPGNVYIDAPRTFYEAYRLFKTDLDYSNQELAKSFCLPEEEIKKYCESHPTMRIYRKSNRLSIPNN